MSNIINQVRSFFTVVYKRRKVLILAPFFIRSSAFNPRRFAAAPWGMPAPLRSAGCLPVVASLLPPGTRLTAPRFARKCFSGKFSLRTAFASLQAIPVGPDPTPEAGRAPASGKVSFQGRHLPQAKQLRLS